MTQAEAAAMFEQFKKQLLDKAKQWKSKPVSNPTEHGFETEVHNQESSSSNSSNKIIQFIRFCLFFAAGLLIFANIKPYIKIVTWLGTGLSDMPIVKQLSQYPIFNWAFSGGGVVMAFIVKNLL